jgi:hypothetical protein
LCKEEVCIVFIISTFAIASIILLEVGISLCLFAENASKKADNQALTKDAQTKGTRGRGRIYTECCKGVGFHLKDRIRLSTHPPRSSLSSLQRSVTQKQPQGLKWCSHIGATCTTKLVRRTTLSSHLIAIQMSEYWMMRCFQTFRGQICIGWLAGPQFFPASKPWDG